MSTPETGDTIAVWFSCGAASACAAKLAIEQYPHCNVRVLNNPVQEEDDDNRRFLHDVEEWIGQPIEIVTNPDYPNCSAEEVWEKRQYVAGNAGAPCTIELKKKARQRWERENHWDHCVLGFTVEEKGRHDRFTMTERDLLAVLIDANMTKQGCYNMLVAAGIEPPRMYRLGYPNANCIGCVKATSPTYWNHVRKVHPEVFQAREEQSRRIGAKLVRCHPRYLNWCHQDEHGFWWNTEKGECLHVRKSNGDLVLVSPRIYLDELPEDAQGRPLKSMDVDCGSFCEEIE